MQRLAFIIVIPTMLAAAFLVAWGAYKGDMSMVGVGMPLMASFTGAAVAFYFPNKADK